MNPFRTVTHMSVGLLAIFLVAYTYYETRDLIEGPVLTIIAPANNATVTNNIVRIRGTAVRIANLSLNGRQIFTDLTGAWSEELLVPKGYTILEVSARDRFNREVKKQIGVVYKNPQ